MNGEPIIQANKKGRENGLFSCVKRSSPSHRVCCGGAFLKMAVDVAETQNEQNT